MVVFMIRDIYIALTEIFLVVQVTLVELQSPVIAHILGSGQFLFTCQGLV